MAELNARHKTTLGDTSQIDALCGELHTEVLMIQAELSAGDRWSRALLILRSLPLSTGEYALAINRLTNAQRYAAEDQQGAARFELNQLARRVKAMGGLCGNYRLHRLPIAVIPRDIA
jgi:hypothetical protein